MPGKSIYVPRFERTCPIILCSSKGPDMWAIHLCKQTTPCSADKTDSKWYHSSNAIWMYASQVSQQVFPYLHSKAFQSKVHLGHFQSQRSSPQFSFVFPNKFLCCFPNESWLHRLPFPLRKFLRKANHLPWPMYPHVPILPARIQHKKVGEAALNFTKLLQVI